MSTTIPIYAGDDKAELVKLRTAVAVAESMYLDALEESARAPRRAGDEVGASDQKAALDAAKATYDAFVDEAAERATEVELRHLGRRRFRDLRLAHPPRTKTVVRDGEQVEETVAEDAPFGFNVETLPLALLAYVDPDDPEVRTIVRPRKSARDLDEWLNDELSEGQFDDLWSAAYRDNVGGVGVDPKLSRYSAATPISDGTSA